MVFGITSHYRFDIHPIGGGIDWDHHPDPVRTPVRRIY